MNLKLDGWPWKTIGHLLYATSNFVHHFVAIRPFKLVTDQKCKICDFFVPRHLEIWWMTLKNNKAPLLCQFNICALFCSHQSIQIGVTVRKAPIWVKISNFWSRVTLKFEGWPWKTIGHLFYATSSFVHHFTVIDEFKLELQSENVQFGSNLPILCPVYSICKTIFTNIGQ